MSERAQSVEEFFAYMREHCADDIVSGLVARGFEPDDSAPAGQLWADNVLSGIGTVRVVLADEAAEVFVFDRHMVHEWGARFTANTPYLVVLATLDAAEAHLYSR